MYALTFVHSAFTMVGMWLFAAFGMFEVKRLAARQARARALLCPRCAACEQSGACAPAVLAPAAPLQHRLCV